MEIVLVKQTDAQLSEEDKAAVRRFLMGHLSGATDKDTRAWNNFIRAMDAAGSGEYFTFKIERRRQGWYHRKHMATISAVFKAQERIADFEAFRLWLKIGSGFVTWMAGPTGGVVPVPKSISYSSCSEEEMREFHENAVAFLITEHACTYLWPKADRQAAQQGMDAILSKFEKEQF
jgi:hypothetical protein